ncbi:MAG: enoyl-CoA hydratase/isomerase family protein, partial [Kordiimonadaceae bacterium]|nr:enoyl-CoA hydratase/isomerase family protein [Kordiimonadaceae bacterium]
MTDFIKTIIEDRVLKITFNRADKKNAITYAMYAAMADALADARTNDDVRAILFTGEGDMFTAGNDLVDFQQAGSLEGEGPTMLFIKELIDAEKPIVAAVDGRAVGIGLTMLLHCDFVYMAENATISAPFVDLALVPENASSLLLPQLVGHARAAEIFMLGQKVTASEAYEMNLINQVCSVDDVLEVATKTAVALGKKAPTALQETKRLMRGDLTRMHASVKVENELFGAQLRSPEVAEAIGAFFEKRAPNFG